MTLRTLLRELSDFDPRSSVYLEAGKLIVGRYSLTIPSRLDQEIEALYQANNGVRGEEK